MCVCWVLVDFHMCAFIYTVREIIFIWLINHIASLLSGVFKIESKLQTQSGILFKNIMFKRLKKLIFHNEIFLFESVIPDYCRFLHNLLAYGIYIFFIPSTQSFWLSSNSLALQKGLIPCFHDLWFRTDAKIC